MATTVPAMKARLGDTDYFILSMKAQELTEKVRIPKELEGWEDMSLEEIYQRDLNYNRVRKQIAPYLANDDSRFFGSIIVAAINFGENVLFEPLTDLAKKELKGPYKASAASMGFLTFTGGEVFVPLDGQHRLKAIEFAVTGRDERGQDIGDITPCTDLAKEDVTVILVPYESKKARRIFTKVNSYAKATTTGQNIITDDDDIVAVLARGITNDLIGARLVKYRTNTLTSKDPHFTTLAIVYRCNEFIINETFPTGKIDKSRLPSKDRIRLYRDKVHEVWELLLEEIDVFAHALSDKEESGDAKRAEIRGSNLLGKPVPQECLVRAFMRLTNLPTGLSYDEACKRLNDLPWSINSEELRIWDRVLWTGGVDGKIITKNRNLATDLVGYLAGEKLGVEELSELQDSFLSQFPEEERESKSLPDPFWSIEA